MFLVGRRFQSAKAKANRRSVLSTGKLATIQRTLLQREDLARPVISDLSRPIHAARTNYRRSQAKLEWKERL
ncbi:hypothetical protein C5Y97_18515 [Blastopirellula marina]|uniref:Uncharacterized protein n=1 Tax=Blastopirellula marina TaxID=124 RepID=A0A2S8FLT0_9BACT|nr:hypothetical protein C5Y98_18505 [Blastopirellula marina]PTL43290.1 hypothetical protein C5Y97_18515 [Blastopirellula marina]